MARLWHHRVLDFYETWSKLEELEVDRYWTVDGVPHLWIRRIVGGSTTSGRATSCKERQIKVIPSPKELRGGVSHRDRRLFFYIDGALVGWLIKKSKGWYGEMNESTNRLTSLWKFTDFLNTGKKKTSDFGLVDSDVFVST